MTRLLLLLLVVMAMLAPVGVSAMDRAEAERAFDEANRMYEREEYAEALAQYRALIAGGYATREVLGNAGDAAVSLNDRGQAVLLYSRALRVDPGYTRVRDNMREIEPASNRVAAGEESLIVLVGEAFARTPGLLWLVLAEVAFALTLLALVMVARSASDSEARGAWISRLAAGAIACAIGFGLVALHAESSRVEGDAVVLRDGTITRTGPGERFPAALELPAGTRIVLPESPREGWAAFRLLDGRAGYIPTSAIEGI